MPTKYTPSIPHEVKLSGLYGWIEQHFSGLEPEAVCGVRDYGRLPDVWAEKIDAVVMNLHLMNDLIVMLSSTKLTSQRTVVMSSTTIMRWNPSTKNNIFNNYNQGCCESAFCLCRYIHNVWLWIKISPNIPKLTMWVVKLNVRIHPYEPHMESTNVWAAAGPELCNSCHCNILKHIVGIFKYGRRSRTYTIQLVVNMFKLHKTANPITWQNLVAFVRCLAYESTNFFDLAVAGFDHAWSTLCKFYISQWMIIFCWYSKWWMASYSK